MEFSIKHSLIYMSCSIYMHEFYGYRLYSDLSHRNVRFVLCSISLFFHIPPPSLHPHVAASASSLSGPNTIVPAHRHCLLYYRPVVTIAISGRKKKDEKGRKKRREKQRRLRYKHRSAANLVELGDKRKKGEKKKKKEEPICEKEKRGERRRG
ncbi:hypothetical protein DM860_008819 [Cuscuta australis]|uniref:Uncharacterized protein n=1 Tax=Cuscuta australis TaxID=267555 RepID=A0A328D768_9ASTE|nr:hypothetical protein DM860_008819 [Cuscuta australis]